MPEKQSLFSRPKCSCGRQTTPLNDFQDVCENGHIIWRRRPKSSKPTNNTRPPTNAA